MRGMLPSSVEILLLKHFRSRAK